MKKLFTFALACAISLSAFTLSASDDHKIYVKTENAYQIGNCFRTQLDDGSWLDSNAVHGDANGVYVLESEIVGPECWHIDYHVVYYPCIYCGELKGEHIPCKNKNCSSNRPS